MANKKDKIFGNDYNTGNIEFEFFGKIQVKEQFNTQSSEFVDESYRNWEREKLQEELYEIFDNAHFRDKYAKIKKVPKAEMVPIYYYFADKIDRTEYSAVQIFTEIAEFMRMNYKNMFHQLLPTDKQDIIRELNDDYHILETQTLKRLF